MDKPAPPNTIHYSEIPDGQPGDCFIEERKAYRREMPRLLAGGNEGKFVMLKGDELLGVFDSWREARQAGLEKFGLKPFMVHEVHEYEPLLRLPTRFYTNPYLAAAMIADLQLVQAKNDQPGRAS